MIYFLIIASIVGAEYVMKQYMEKNSKKEKTILGGKVRLNLYHNKGVALNVLENNIKLIKIITGTTVGILLLVLAYSIGARESKLKKLALSLLLGGAISNLIDRIKQGYVTDYFSFEQPKQIKHIVFNLADFAVFIGGIFLFLAELLKKE